MKVLDSSALAVSRLTGPMMVACQWNWRGVISMSANDVWGYFCCPKWPWWLRSCGGGGTHQVFADRSCRAWRRRITAREQLIFSRSPLKKQMGMGWVGVERKRSRIVVRLTDQGLRVPYWFSWEPCWEMTIQVLEDVTPGFDARILLKGRNECNVEFAGRMGAEALWFSEGKAVSYKLRRWFRQGLNTDYIHRIVSLGWRLTRIEMERILSFPSPIGFKAHSLLQNLPHESSTIQVLHSQISSQKIPTFHMGSKLSRWSGDEWWVHKFPFFLIAANCLKSHDKE